ncbi:MAG: hypothetical protein HKN00_05695 [Flavobacteriaceae bacterium]|nr:hypothetical protein [Flavobacteriaceae bacterium]
MADHYQLTDSEFEQSFENRSLDPRLFNHEAHLRLAWIHITKYGLEQAIVNLSEQIYNFAYNLGAKDKFNTTVTLAAVRAVYHFMLKAESKNFRDFINEFPQLKNNFKGLSAQHYDINIFDSELARSSFLEPDRLPFDCIK